MENKTALQELIEEFEEIKLTKCKTLQEIIFFDGVLAIIESKYIEKEKEQMIDFAFNFYYDFSNETEVPFYKITENIDNAEDYYNKTYNK